VACALIISNAKHPNVAYSTNRPYFEVQPALNKSGDLSAAKFLIAVSELQLALRRDAENSADLLC
jgi:hypothetical protein